jgi:iron(III) transport system ATP-binding protein
VFDSDPSPEGGRPVVLRVRELARAYEDFRLGPVSFDLASRETLVILGPNGSGKSTLLRLLAGLEAADRGSLELRGRDISALPAHQRGVGMVFQDLALFPQRTVWENVTYGLALRRVGREELERRGEELLQEFRLRAFSERYPNQLSGGERQRVALARALAPSPAILLFDEPLSAADPRIARELQSDLREFLRRSSIPAIYVTHDLDEGFFLADRLALLDGGKWVQEGPAQQVYEHPRNPFAARFLGYHVLESPGGGGRLLAVPPEELKVVEARTPGALPGTVLGRKGGPRARLLVRLDRSQAEPSEHLSKVLEIPEGRVEPGSFQASGKEGQRVGVLVGAGISVGPSDPPDEFKKGEGSGSSLSSSP